MTGEGRELGWDERITAPSEGGFVVFPDGIYPFTVLNFERGRHTGSDKLPPCNMMTANIEFNGGPQLGTTIVKHKLFLHTKETIIGLLSQFFRGVGLRKHGDDLELNWAAAEGRTGFAKLGKRVFEGRDYQDIKKFIDPEEQPTRTPAQVAQPAQSAQPAKPAMPVSDDAPF